MISMPPGARRVSSSMTYFNKRVLPLLFFGMLLAFAGLGAAALRAKPDPVLLPILLIPAFVAVLAYFILKKLVFDLVDEVWDAGDALFVKNGGVLDRIPLTNVVNVSYTVVVNPPRVTLLLRQPCRFGREVTFSPLIRFKPFAHHPLIDDLIQRVDAARNRTMTGG